MIIISRMMNSKKGFFMYSIMSLVWSVWTEVQYIKVPLSKLLFIKAIHVAPNPKTSFAWIQIKLGASTFCFRFPCIAQTMSRHERNCGWLTPATDSLCAQRSYLFRQRSYTFALLHRANTHMLTHFITRCAARSSKTLWRQRMQSISD